MLLLIHGADVYSSLERAKSLFAELKEKSPDVDVFTEDLTERNLEIFFQIVEGQSLFSAQKIALLKGLTKNKEFKNYQDKILASFKNIPEDIQLILWEDRKVAGNTKFAKYFKTAKLEELFEEKKKPEVKKLAKEFAAQSGISLNIDALEALVFNTNYDIGTIKNEIDKLALLQKEVITREDVEETVANTNESLIWDLTDAITESDKEKALKSIEDLLQNESEQFIIIPMIGRQIKLMVMVKLLLNQGKDAGEIARELRLPPFILYKIIKYAGEISLDKLKKMFIKLVDMDYAIKMGKMEPEIALSLFCTLI